MTTLIAIVGAGGHGRECLGIAGAMVNAGAQLKVVGVYDDQPSSENVNRLGRLGYEILGTFDDLLERSDVSVCLGVGNGQVRERLDAQLRAREMECATLVHPDSTLGSNVTLGAGSVIFPGVRLTTNIQLGRHVHVNQNATVGHDCLVGDYVTVNPQAAVSGSVSLGSGSTVGAGAVVLQGLSVAAGAFVGASACVVRDVPTGVIVRGVPAS